MNILGPIESTNATNVLYKSSIFYDKTNVANFFFTLFTTGHKILATLASNMNH